MTKKLLTEETRQALLKLTEEELEKKSKFLEQSRKHLLLVKNTESLITPNKELVEFSKILEFKMLIGFISLDLVSNTRAYLKAEYQYEGLFSMRQFIVIINEGYKNIYNFKTVNSKGIEILKNRNKSFWVKDIGEIIKSKSDNELKKKYFFLTTELDTYFNDNFQGIKDQRNLSVHYDNNLIKVYDMITNLNAEAIFKKYIPFYKILREMFIFLHELVMSYQVEGIDKHIS